MLRFLYKYPSTNTRGNQLLLLLMHIEDGI